MSWCLSLDLSETAQGERDAMVVWYEQKISQHEEVLIDEEVVLLVFFMCPDDQRNPEAKEYFRGRSTF